MRRYSDVYFSKAREGCEQAGNNRRVLYQVFQRREAVLCGMKYVLPLFDGVGPEVEVEGLEDGSPIASTETVMHIRGPVQELLELETVYLGLLARMTAIATQVRAAVEAARGKPVLFFPARFDAYKVQEYDGYAAMVGGAAGASTPAGAEAFGQPPVGTMPHAMIAAFGGNTAAAALAFARARPREAIWALVDFENDNARSAVEVFRTLRENGLKLAGVRLDTSQDVVDKGLEERGIHVSGVRPELVELVRQRLDAAGAREVKIAVSGGFTAEKIREFERSGAAVDVYAVGEWFLRGATPFTSDIVGYYEGEKFVPCAKVGRQYRPNPRMKRLR